MEHLNTRSAFSRPHSVISVGPDPNQPPRPPPLHPPSCPTLCAWMNTSAPAWCADFSQPQQMVLTLQRAHAATPGTQGKSVRALATLSGSTRTHGKHRRNSMCAGANMQTNAAAGGGASARNFREAGLDGNTADEAAAAAGARADSRTTSGRSCPLTKNQALKMSR